MEVYAYGGRSAFTVPNYFTDIVEAKFYPIDDLALSVGHIYSFGRNAVTGEVEYLLPQFRGGNIAPSAFVKASYGWNSSSNIMAGIRIYFGNHDKTLIRRQREDDPSSRTQRLREYPEGSIPVPPTNSSSGASNTSSSNGMMNMMAGPLPMNMPMNEKMMMMMMRHEHNHGGEMEDMDHHMMMHDD
jgi:hypothetical protein